MIRKQLTFPIVREICREEGILFMEEPSRGMFGVMLFENGRKFFVRDINLNLNYASSKQITKNKALTSYFLEKFGYCVPHYTMVYSEEACKKHNLQDTLDRGIEFARTVGYPIMLKLNDSSQGRGIYKVYNETELKEAANTMFQSSNTFQIQKFYEMKDYRVVVLGEKVISAYQRLPLHVIGDGIHTVEELLIKKQKQYQSDGRDTLIDIGNGETKSNLSHLGYTLKTVLALGETCILRNVSNLSAGGECVELTDVIHNDYKEICLKIAKDLTLNLCGIDIMCNDICSPLETYIILEVNSSPGLDNYAFQGKEQREYAKRLYREVILYIKEYLAH